MTYRYGPWEGGPDPLAPPFDAGRAVDELGEAVLDGAAVEDALAELLRRGTAGSRGLDELRRLLAQARSQARHSGRLDATLPGLRRLLDQALAAERETLAGETGEDARLAQIELAALPSGVPGAIRALADYDWHSPEGRASYQQIRDLLRGEVVDSQFRGMKAALAAGGAEELAAVAAMLDELNELLDADARGADTTQHFADFISRHGAYFPDAPADLEELVDSLARRAAAGARLMASLRPEQREELTSLLASVLAEAGLGEPMARLAAALQQRRGDLDWSSRAQLRGAEPLGLSDATSALAELADLDALDSALAQDYPGASLEDIDDAAVARMLGSRAVQDVAALRRLERALAEQGYLTRTGDRLQLTPQAVRRLGETALRRVFTRLTATGRGDHDVTQAGAAGEPTGGSRAWQFGDQAPFDVVRTLHNAVLRTGRLGAGATRLQAADFAVVDTERRAGAAVALLVDLSYSMALRGAWGTAKATALALHALVDTRYRQDAVAIIGFADYARQLAPVELAGLAWDPVKGTNLQHALIIAGRHLARHPEAEPVVMVVTDGEPTAHLLPDGSAFFDWPPDPRTLAATMAEVDRITRRGATINIFMLDDEPRLIRFVHLVARRNGGRVFRPDQARLGEYVVADYLRARRGASG